MNQSYQIKDFLQDAYVINDTAETLSAVPNVSSVTGQVKYTWQYFRLFVIIFAVIYLFKGRKGKFSLIDSIFGIF